MLHITYIPFFILLFVLYNIYFPFSCMLYFLQQNQMKNLTNSQLSEIQEDYSHESCRSN